MLSDENIKSIILHRHRYMLNISHIDKNVYIHIKCRNGRKHHSKLQYIFHVNRLINDNTNRDCERLRLKENYTTVNLLIEFGILNSSSLKAYSCCCDHRKRSLSYYTTQQT